MRKVVIALYLLFGFNTTNAWETPRTLYVLNGLGRTVSTMDLETEQINNDVALTGNIPNRIHTNGDKVYVVNSTPPGITVIDGNTATVEKTIALNAGSNPWDMAVVGVNKAYVTNLLGNNVNIIDLASGDSLGSIEVGKAPEGILVVNNTGYVANSGGYPEYSPSTVSVIDIRTNQVTKTLNVPMNPQELALAPDGNIHVVCTGNYVDVSSSVAVINPFGDVDWTASVVDTIEIGGFPGDIAITADGVAFLPDFGDGSNGFLYSYNALTLDVVNDASDPIRVGNGAMNLFYDSGSDDLYVNNFSDDAVQLLAANDGSVVATFGFGHGAQDMAILEPVVESDPWADAVVSFSPGEGAGFGENFYPENVLGPPDPDPTLTTSNASAKPQEILSLGHAGEIIMEFTDNYIVDGEGVDFTVFENVFYIFGDTTQPFVEAAHVAASMDGQNWQVFHWDTTTWVGFAGVFPTKNNQKPTDATVSGGDSFDLADIGLAYAKYVRLTDIGDLKQEGQYNDWFDLDAVVAVNSMPGQPTSVQLTQTVKPDNFNLMQNYPNPFNPSTRIEFSVTNSSRVQIRIFNLRGQLIRALVDQTYSPGRHKVEWNGKNDQTQEAPSGIYVYEMKAGEIRHTRRLTLLR